MSVRDERESRRTIKHPRVPLGEIAHLAKRMRHSFVGLAQLVLERCADCLGLLGARWTAWRTRINGAARPPLATSICTVSLLIGLLNRSLTCHHLLLLKCKLHQEQKIQGEEQTEATRREANLQ